MFIITLALGQAFAVGPISVAVDAGRASHGVVSGVVDAPPDQLLAIVMDCAGSDAWFPELRDTRVVPGADVRCEGLTDLPWPIPDRTWQIDTTAGFEDGARIATFRYVGGEDG